LAEFKDRLKLLRKEKGLTQKELAKIFNSTDVAINRYEKGLRELKLGYSMLSKLESGEQNNPSLLSIITLAQFFDVSTDYLLGLSDERKPNVIEKPIDLSKIPTDELMKEVLKRWL